MDLHPVNRIPESHLTGPPVPAQRFGLIQRLRSRLRTRHYSPHTEAAYVEWLRPLAGLPIVGVDALLVDVSEAFVRRTNDREWERDFPTDSNSGTA
jgi:hypothetical protein